MACPKCGSDTSAPGGRCTVCGALVPSDVATALLTPTPNSVPRPEDGDSEAGTHVTPRSQLGPSSAPGASGADADATLVTGGTPGPIESDETEIGVTRPAPAGGPLGVGQGFGTRYHVIKLLGAGGMGAVYQAWDQELGVAVALKVIRPEAIEDPEAAAEMQRRFKRELLLARQVTHKNVVRIHDLGEIEGIKYITMPFIPGEDLSATLRREGRLPVARVLRIARQVASGLAAAHEAGVVHRDLKPPNIMVDPDGNAVIMDFGIARSASMGGSTVAGTVIGTLAYMAPEQARGEAVDQRADIYAFGLILYDMLVGRRQTATSTSALAELVARMQHAMPPVRSVDPAIPETVEHIVARCLEPDRANRYQTMAELIADLDLLDADGHPIRPLSLEKTKEMRRPRPGELPGKGLPWKWIVLAAAVLIVAGIGFAFRGRLAGRPAVKPAASGQAISLAILPFRNASGDSSLDWLGPSLAEMLRTDVGQSASLQTVPTDRLRQILRDLRISGDSTFDPPTLRRLAEFSNADTVLWGQYLKFGNEIRIDATLVDVKRQRSLPLKAQAPSQSGLLAAVDELAQSIRESLSLSSNVLEELKATAFKPSTKSLEALRAYNEGLQLASQGKHSEAQKKFQASVQADPEFALAYAKLGQSYANLGYDTEAEQNSRRAVELAEKLPEREKYLITASHARIVNDTGKAIEAYENLAKVSPEDSEVNFELAALYEAQGAFDQARAHYKKVLQRDPKYVAALLASGRVEIKAGNPQGSLDHLNQALSLAIQLENDEQKADVLHAIGAAYKFLDKPNDALRYYQESLDIKRRIGQKRGIAVTLGEIAQIRERLGNQDAALANLKEALQIQREIGDKRGTGLTLINLGGHYEDSGNYDLALQNYKESLQIQREVGNQDGEGLCLNNIGNIYLFKTQYDDAQTYFERALQIREKTKNPRDIADTLHNLAETATNKGQYDQALKHYLRALQIRRDAGDKRGAAIESHNMGTLFEYQGQYGAAVSAKQEALKAFQELKDRGFWMGEILSGTGHALAMLGRSDEAQKQLAEALKLAGELQNKALTAQILNFQGDRLYYRGDARAAQPLYEQALQAASKTGDRRLELLSRVNLAKIAIAQGRPQPAIETLKKLADESDAVGLKYLAVESEISLGEALVGAKRYREARQELERALAKSEKLGLRALLARSHSLLASALRSEGNAADASRHLGEARRILEEIRKEARTDDVVKRSDLSPILADAG
jgi:tetratricopeptide (TPR) repeat protein/tRNA A-37 threonylcarbamoyl transferase component Bud32